MKKIVVYQILNLIISHEQSRLRECIKMGLLKAPISYCGYLLVYIWIITICIRVYIFWKFEATDKKKPVDPEEILDSALLAAQKCRTMKFGLDFKTH